MIRNNVLDMFEKYYGLYEGDKVEIDGYAFSPYIITKDGFCGFDGAKEPHITLDFFAGKFGDYWRKLPWIPEDGEEYWYTSGSLENPYAKSEPWKGIIFHLRLLALDDVSRTREECIAKMAALIERLKEAAKG